MTFATSWACAWEIKHSLDEGRWQTKSLTRYVLINYFFILCFCFILFYDTQNMNNWLITELNIGRKLLWHFSVTTDLSGRWIIVAHYLLKSWCTSLNSSNIETQNVTFSSKTRLKQWWISSLFLGFQHAQNLIYLFLHNMKIYVFAVGDKSWMILHISHIWSSWPQCA